MLSSSCLKENVKRVCILLMPGNLLHTLSLSDHGAFIRISDTKGNPIDKLKHLHKTRDKKLNQSHRSPYCMQLVCDQIPNTFPDDLKTVGYHRQCYQRFTSNLHLLRDVTHPGPSTPQRHHSLAAEICLVSLLLDSFSQKSASSVRNIAIK